MCFDFDQKRAYDSAVFGNNVFISGGGGVGKSFVIRSIIDDLRANSRNVVTCAYTKYAALNIDPVNGLTIYKAFNTFPKGLVDDEQGLIRLRKSAAMNADTIIIDEISMCSKEFFTYINKAIRRISLENNYKNIQIIVSGDFFQLPPICKDLRNAEYAFESHFWDKSNLDIVMLETPHRQENKEFYDRLYQIRRGENIMDNLQYIKDHSHYMEKREDAVTLCSYRTDVKKMNNEKIATLPGKSRVYMARTNSQKFLVGLTVWDCLELKVGTLVMTIYNDPEKRFYNGLTGRIIDMKEKSVIVRFDDSTPIKPHVEEIGYRRWIDDEDGIFAEQLPLIPAYSITIHKAQGCTLDYVNVNPRSFTDGQLYVALSRVTDINHLYVTKEIRPNDIKVNKKVLDFYSKYEREKRHLSA